MIETIFGDDFTSATASDHGSLAGLSGDDHLQYMFLAGRSGQQILKGGTGTTDDIIIQATAGVGASGSEVLIKGGNDGADTFTLWDYEGNVTFYEDV